MVITAAGSFASAASNRPCAASCGVAKVRCRAEATEDPAESASSAAGNIGNNSRKSDFCRMIVLLGSVLQPSLISVRGGGNRRLGGGSRRPGGEAARPGAARETTTQTAGSAVTEGAGPPGVTGGECAAAVANG